MSTRTKTMTVTNATQAQAEDEKEESVSWLKQPNDLQQVQTVQLFDQNTKILVAADNSGSTAGAVLQSIRQLCSDFNKSMQATFSLWNSCVHAPKAFQHVQWGSGGGTDPHLIFQNSAIQNLLPHVHCFALITDGEIDSMSVQQCALSCNVVAHLPCICIIVSPHADVSVVSPIFHVSKNAVCLQYTHNKLYVLQGKGAWSELEPQAVTSIAQVLEIAGTIQTLPPVAQHSIVLDELRGAPILHVKKMLQDKKQLNLEAIHQVLANVPNLAQLCKDWGLSAKLRAFCARCNAELNQMNQAVPAATSDIDASITQTISRIKNSNDVSEKQHLRGLLLSMFAEKNAAVQASASTGKMNVKNMRRLVGAVVERLTELERSGYDASSLSNRAARAKLVSDVDFSSLQQQNKYVAPEEAECLICANAGPDVTWAVCTRAVREVEQNTNDYALNWPLVVCSYDVNRSVFLPDSALICFDCAKACHSSPLTREDVLMVMPLVSVGGNKDLWKAFVARSFFGDRLFGTNIQFFAGVLSSLLESDVGLMHDPQRQQAFRWMLNQVVDSFSVPAQFNDGALSPFREVLSNCLSDPLALELLKVHYPIQGGWRILCLQEQLGCARPLDAGQSLLWSRMICHMLSNVLQVIKKPEPNTASPAQQVRALMFTLRYNTPIAGTGHLLPVQPLLFLSPHQAACAPKNLDSFALKLNVFYHHVEQEAFDANMSVQTALVALLDKEPALLAALPETTQPEEVLTEINAPYQRPRSEHGGLNVPFVTVGGASLLRCSCGYNFVKPRERHELSVEKMVHVGNERMVKHFKQVYNDVEQNAHPNAKSSFCSVHYAMIQTFYNLFNAHPSPNWTDFVEKVEEFIRNRGPSTGYVHQPNLESDIQMLLPSFQAVLAQHNFKIPEPHMTREARIAEELHLQQ